MVRGVKAGSTKIRATAHNGIYKECTVTVTAASPVWSLSRSSITFPAATVGYSTQAAVSTTISNTGTVALTSVSASITTGSSYFEITVSPSSSIAAGSSSSVSVRPKTGLTAGTYTGTLTVSTGNGGNKTVSPLSFTVNGPIWSLSQSSIEFPAATVGYGAQTAVSTTISNTGTVALTSVSASITTGSLYFEITSSPSTTIAVGSSSSVSARPKTGLAAGTYNGVLTVSTGNGGSKTVSLSFTVNAATPVWSLSRSNYTFPAATVGYGTQTAVSTTISNTGTVALTSVSASITTGSLYFEITSSPSTTIAAGSSSSVSARPKTGLAAGTYSGVLTVATANGGSKTVSLSFTVNATTPGAALIISPTSGATYTINSSPSYSYTASNATKYHCAVKIIDGNPDPNNDNEGGTSVLNDQTITDTTTNFPISNDSIHAGKWVKLYVRGINSAGAYGSPDLCYVQIKPLTPALGNPTQSNGTVSLSWGNTAGAVSYNVYRSTSASSGYSKINNSSVTATGYSDTPGTGTFYYKVEAVAKTTSLADARILSRGITGDQSAYKSITVTAPEWTITPTPLSITFPAAIAGYITQASVAKAINNTGTVTLTSVSASITTGGSFFEVTISPSTSIAAGVSSSVSVRPKTGLTANTYNGTLRVSTANSGYKDVSLSFTVNAPPPSPIINTVKISGNLAIKAGTSETVLNPNNIVYNRVSGQDDPFAASTELSGIGIARYIDYAYTLDSSGNTNNISWTYSFINSKGQTAHSGTGGTFSGNGHFSIKLPDKIGKYTLQIKAAGANGTTTRNHTIYVLNSTPREVLGSTIPKTKWLDMAMSFSGNIVADLSAPTNIHSAFSSGIHSNPYNWIYGYYLGQIKDSVNDLIEKSVPLPLSSPSLRGDCFTFADVHRFLAMSIGVLAEYASLTVTFIADPEKKALDNNASANCYKVTDPNDEELVDNNERTRWFSKHAQVKYGSLYYDPTFDLPPTDQQESVVWAKITSHDPDLSSGIYTKKDGTMFRVEKLKITGGAYGWSLFKYWDYPNPIPSGFPPTNDFFNTLNRITNSKSTTGQLRVPPAISISGYDEEILVDEDNNDLAEFLVITPCLDIFQCGTYNIYADIYSLEGEYIDSASLTQERTSSPINSITFEDQYAAVPLYFTGLPLSEAEIDGPYLVIITITDEYGSVRAEDYCQTDAYTADQFQGELLEIVSINDQSLTPNNSSLADALRFTATVQAKAAGTYYFSGSLFANDANGEYYLTDINRDVFLAIGSNQVSFDFDGKLLRSLKADGPYNFYLNSNDGLYINNENYVSNSYLFTDFVQPDAYFTGELTDSSNSSRGAYGNNGEDITIACPVNAVLPDSYKIMASIDAAQGACVYTLEILEQEEYLSGTNQEIELAFSGANLSTQGMTGPYRVSVGIFDEYGEQISWANCLVATDTPLHLGDVNEDGVISPEDALIVMQHVLGLITLNFKQLILADVNEDGVVDMDDVQMILRMVVGGLPLKICLDSSQEDVEQMVGELKQLFLVDVNGDGTVNMEWIELILETIAPSLPLNPSSFSDPATIDLTIKNLLRKLTKNSKKLLE